LKELMALMNLKKLNVWETSVTDLGIRALQKKLPSVEIINRNTSPLPFFSPAVPVH